MNEWFAHLSEGQRLALNLALAFPIIGLVSGLVCVSIRAFGSFAEPTIHDGRNPTGRGTLHLRGIFLWALALGVGLTIGVVLGWLGPVSPLDLLPRMVLLQWVGLSP